MLGKKCEACAKAVILLVSLMVAFKSQREVDRSGFTSWRCYSVILTFRAGVSAAQRMGNEDSYFHKAELYRIGFSFAEYKWDVNCC